MLFDEATLRKLNQLSLVARRVRAGLLKGERRSTKRGSSVEFADYRNYAIGDDLRRLDWNIYARLNKPFVKMMQEEEDLAVHILVDISASMDWGEGSANKMAYAMRLAGALSAIALGAGDRLSLALLSDGQVAGRFGPSRGAGQLMGLLSFLERQHATGGSALAGALRDYGLSAGRAGLSFVISDFLVAEPLQDSFAQLLGRGYELTLLHVLAPDELDPPLAGDLRLVDVENGQFQDLSLDGGMRDLYRRRLVAWQQGISAEARKRGMGYLSINTAHAWDKVVLYEMRRMGMVK